MTRSGRDVVRNSIRSELTHQQKISLVHAPSQKPVLKEIQLTLQSWVKGGRIK